MMRRTTSCLPVLVAMVMHALMTVTALAESGSSPAGQWRGLHLIHHTTDGNLEALGGQLPALAKLGINVLILEVNYGFRFESHPELRQGEEQITKEGARNIVRTCRKHGIRLIPQFQCVAHQSWKKQTFPLDSHVSGKGLSRAAFRVEEGGSDKGADRLQYEAQQPEDARSPVHDLEWEAGMGEFPAAHRRSQDAQSGR